MPLKSVFIDAGNTLLYEMPSRAQIYAQAAREHGRTVEEGEMATLMRRVHAELPRELLGEFRYSDGWFAAFIRRVFRDELRLPDAALPELSERLFARFSDPRTFQLFPGALELLDGARNLGLCVGIVSNWSARLPQLLAGLGVLERVDLVLCSAIERCEKPEPEIFRRALERSGAAPSEALFAGDHPEKDVAGAERAGMRAVLVDHSGNAAAVSAHRVRSLPELLALVGELAA